VTPDVLVSDIGMPGKDGYTLIREIGKREAAAATHLQAIALTAFAAIGTSARRWKPLRPHCAKPLQPLKLLWQIQRVLAGRHNRTPCRARYESLICSASSKSSLDSTPACAVRRDSASTRGS
jgi:DNA-binding NarL/FixJ family response regulator